MALEWTYLLKVNVTIILFYIAYKLFCQRDTFFVWHRISLLGFLLFSLGYPLLNIEPWVEKQPIMYELNEYYTSFINMDSEKATSATHTTTMPNMQTWMMYLYWTGLTLLTIRFLIQIASIIRMRRKGEIIYLNNQKVINTPQPIAPFSFFKWIFIHVPHLKNENYTEVLIHEQTHAYQHHSIDVMLSEIVCMICWFNPFVWLLKNEIRLNLEYMADKEVTNGMNDYKQYQYHLLEVALANQTNTLYNYFNVLHLKKRIIMMNKKRTRMTGRIKYALFAPLAIAMLLANNISCTSSPKKKDAFPTPANVETQTTESTDEHVYEIVEEQAEFPGGMSAYLKWISENVEYPTSASEKGIQGRVYVAFIVQSDGSLTDFKIARGVHPDLDNAAIQAAKKMPKWKPGKQDGKSVSVKAIVPVNFKLM